MKKKIRKELQTMEPPVSSLISVLPPALSPTDVSTSDSDTNRFKFQSKNLLLKCLPSRQIFEFLVLTILALAIAGFCMGMIATGHLDSYYFAILTFIFGVFVPNPKLPGLPTKESLV